LILATHAVVGAAIASLIPNHPFGALVAGIASHFAIDAFPHWDYRLRSMFRGAEKGAALPIDIGLVIDLGLIGLDACLGLALAIWLFSTPATIATILLGALGGMLPDPLQFAHRLYPHEPLRSLQRFHSWIHSKTKLAWPLGVTTQAAFALAVAVVAKALV
jgi:hypothetical protein